MTDRLVRPRRPTGVAPLHSMMHILPRANGAFHRRPQHPTTQISTSQTKSTVRDTVSMVATGAFQRRTLPLSHSLFCSLSDFGPFSVFFYKTLPRLQHLQANRWVVRVRVQHAQLRCGNCTVSKVCILIYCVLFCCILRVGQLPGSLRLRLLFLPR
jgi:hypothetical protein